MKAISSLAGSPRHFPAAGCHCRFVAVAQAPPSVLRALVSAPSAQASTWAALSVVGRSITHIYPLCPGTQKVEKSPEIHSGRNCHLTWGPVEGPLIPIGASARVFN